MTGASGRRHLLLVNRYFWPDESATAMLATDLAESLVAAGYAVEVIASAAGYERSRDRLPARDSFRGATVHRVWSPGLGRHRVWARLTEAAVFHVAVRTVRCLNATPDVVVAMTDPPLLITSAEVLARRSEARLVHFAADVYPDMAVALGVLPQRSPVTSAVAALTRAALGRCDRVVTLGERMRERLLACGVPSERLSVVPPWAVAPCEEHGARDAGDLRRRLGLDGDDLLAMYAGNLGRCHPWRPLLAAMVALADQPRLHWAFVGGGANRVPLEAEVRARGLRRVVFLPYQPRAGLAGVLAAADFHLVTQDQRTVGLCVPSKLAGVLAAGRPVIFVGPADSDTAAAVLRSGCGFVVQEGDDGAMLAAVRMLAESTETRARLAANARRAYWVEAAPQVALARFRDVIDGLFR